MLICKDHALSQLLCSNCVSNGYASFLLMQLYRSYHLTQELATMAYLSLYLSPRVSHQEVQREALMNLIGLDC